MDVDNETVMRELTRMSIEAATMSIAHKARDFAKTLPKGIDGASALEAFADAIERTNAKAFTRDSSQ